MQANSASYPATFTLDPPEKVANWRPLVNWLFAIPHFLVLSALNSVSEILGIVSWFIILFTGELPEALANFQVMIMRYSARAYVFASLETQWAKLERGQELTRKERADTVLARQFAFQTGRRVTQMMYDTIGGAAVYAKNPFDRQLRDMTTACQHIVAQPKTVEGPGALLLGVDDGKSPML